ncbi:MAG: hypothetical protein E7243_02645 [Lacrimispora celerecrescens]|nr:hypothetical protein [Lacrimispora celerecrescens]
MDYYNRYGLEFNPFLKNSKELIVKTNEYSEVLFRLDYLVKTRGCRPSMTVNSDKHNLRIFFPN